MPAIFYTIILLGSLQGFITGGLLFFGTNRNQSNRLLAVMMWLMALASLNIYLSYTGWYYSGTGPAIIHAVVPMVILMPVGPLLYFYIQSSLDPTFSITKKQGTHFLPVIIDLVPSIVTLIYMGGVTTGIISPYTEKWGNFLDNYNVYSDIPRWISLAGYSALSFHYLSVLKKKENALPPAFKWMQQVVYIFLAFAIIWLFYLIPYVIPSYTDTMLNTFTWYPVYTVMAVMIYSLGIKGYLSYLHIAYAKKKPAVSNSVTPAVASEAILLLQKSMQEDLVYLNPSLNIGGLALYTGIPQKTISIVLNQYMQKSFNEFVNSYRVEAVKKKLQGSELNNLTIAGLALECGFNSKATFQRIFKEMTGISPTEFRKTLINNGQ